MTPIRPGDPIGDVGVAVRSPDEARPVLTWEGIRYGLQRLALERGEWAGIPVPIAGLRVEDRYPWKGVEAIGRREEDVEEEARAAAELKAKGLKQGNRWHAYSKIDADIVLVTKAGRTTRALVLPRGPGRRAGMMLSTFAAVPVWDVDAEIRAMDKLASLVTAHAFKCYLMTGAFLETSSRSAVTYVFRRLRPTLALRPHPKIDDVRVIAALCLHPIAYYEDSWAGALVPTDDVLAHLVLMRGDEHRYWRQANQHPAWAPEAGL